MLVPLDAASRIARWTAREAELDHRQRPAQNLLWKEAERKSCRGTEAQIENANQRLKRVQPPTELYAALKAAAWQAKQRKPDSESQTGLPPLLQCGSLPSARLPEVGQFHVGMRSVGVLENY